MSRIQLDRKRIKFKSFPTMLQTTRSKQGFTKEKLAEMIGVSPKTVYNYEQGLSQPNIEIILNISKVLQINLIELCPELCLLNPQKILYERHKHEFESAILFLRNASDKDFAKLEMLFKLYKLSENIEETLDIDIIVHKTILKYMPPSKKSKCNQLINNFFQHINTFVDPLSENKEDEAIHYEIHYKLLESIINKNKNQVLTNYENHLKIAENALLKFSTMYN